MIEKWYLYYVIVVDKPVWVGISKTPHKRFLTHLSPDKREPNIKKVMWAKLVKEKNITPILKVISEFNSKKEALKAEKEHTLEWRSKTDLLNIYDGCIPDEKNRGKSSLRNMGKKHSEATKNKIRIFFSQKKYADAARENGKKAARRIVDQNRNIYYSISEAARVTNIHRVSIGMNLSGKFKQIKGYTFKYLEDQI